MNLRTVTYEQIRPDLATGDLVLFSGKGGFSAGIKWFTRSRWSHVGMILVIPEWDTVLLWESTTLSSLKDVESNTARRGVQLVSFSDRLRNYGGEVAVRRLRIDRTDRMQQALSSFRNEVRDRPYEEDTVELIKAAYDGPFGDNTEDLSSLFCSELVAESYQRMGLLPNDPPSNEYVPNDFASTGPGVPLLAGALDQEVLVTL